MILTLNVNTLISYLIKFGIIQVEKLHDYIINVYIVTNIPTYNSNYSVNLADILPHNIKAPRKTPLGNPIKVGNRWKRLKICNLIYKEVESLQNYLYAKKNLKCI
jgi:hypothetical protein